MLRVPMTWLRFEHFTQTDPISAEVGEPYPSAFVYGNNNPMAYTDPSGMRGSLVFQTPNPLLIVLDGGGGPEDAKASFAIPKWPGFGRTRMNFYIRAGTPCLGMCLQGDGSGDRALNDFEPPSRVRFVLDHENGRGFMAVSHSTAALPATGATIAQRPIRVISGPYDQRAQGGDQNFVNLVRVADLNPADNLVLQYRALDSFVPQGAGGVAPAAFGVIRFGRQGTSLLIDGKINRFPSVEIIRDSPSGSARVFQANESLGPGEGLARSKNLGPLTCSFTACRG